MKTIGRMGLMGALVICPAESEAKIGESKDQCKARYQETGRPNRFDNLFRKGGVETDCTFDEEGRCVRVSYRILFIGAVDDSGMGSRLKFTADQVKKLMDLNAGGSPWEKKKDVPGGSEFEGVFITKDGSRQARASFTGVTIEMTSYAEKQKALVTADAIGSTVDEMTK